MPSDHGYAMFRAISKLIPEAQISNWLAVETIPGIARTDGNIRLGPHSLLRMRLPQARASLMLKLAGRRLDVNGYSIRFEAPQIFLLRPSSSLRAGCVTIKGVNRRDQFLNRVAQKMDEFAVRGEPEIGPRCIFRVGGRKLVGYGLRVHDLSEEGSILLQEQGLGNRRHLGCGFFVPIRKSRISDHTCRPTFTVQRNRLYAR